MGGGKGFGPHFPFGEEDVRLNFVSLKHYWSENLSPDYSFIISHKCAPRLPWPHCRSTSSAQDLPLVPLSFKWLRDKSVLQLSLLSMSTEALLGFQVSTSQAGEGGAHP